MTQVYHKTTLAFLQEAELIIGKIYLVPSSLEHELNWDEATLPRKSNLSIYRFGFNAVQIRTKL